MDAIYRNPGSCSLGAGRAVPWDKATRFEADHSHQLPKLRIKSLLKDMPWWGAQVQSYLLSYIIISPLRQQGPCRLDVQHSSGHWRVVVTCTLTLLSCYPWRGNFVNFLLRPHHHLLHQWHFFDRFMGL